MDAKVNHANSAVARPVTANRSAKHVTPHADREFDKHEHFKKVCRSAHQKAIRALDASVACDTPANTLFVDALSGPEPSNNWHAEVSINNVIVKFRLDTGADATVLPIEIFNQQPLCNTPLSAADKVLCRPNRAKIDVIGYFTAALQLRDKSSTQNVYVLRDVHQPLFGCDAIDSLDIIKHLNAVDANSPRHEYSDLFKGLGRMSGEYTLRLRQDAKPFALFPPHRVPVNLLSHLKNELD